MEVEGETPPEKEECNGAEQEKKETSEAKQDTNEVAHSLCSGDSEANFQLLGVDAVKSCCEKADDQQQGTSKKAQSMEFKVLSRGSRERKYRSRSSSEDSGDQAGEGAIMVVDMNTGLFDDSSTLPNPNLFSKDNGDQAKSKEESTVVGTKVDVDSELETETMDKTNAAAAVAEQPHTSKRRRSKRKSREPLAEFKKRISAFSTKKWRVDTAQTQEADGNDDDKPQTSNSAVQANIESTSDDDSDDSLSLSTEYDTSSSVRSVHNSDSEKEEKPLTDDEVWLEKDTARMGLPTWNAVEELWKRERGCRDSIWRSRVRGSRAMVQRFEQQFKLDAHEGCVNALHFNQTGTMLASGSDDLNIHIWEWMSSRTEPYISYSSGHGGNVFQTKFMPNSNDLTLISCARDGEVRVGYLSLTGTCRKTKNLARHRGPAHKLALDSAGCPSTFLSCGEDGVVMYFDLREDKPKDKLVTVKSGNEKVPLYSIDSSPKQPYEFAVSGRDQWARVYDRRMLDAKNPETVSKYCPHHLENAPNDTKANITCLVYSHDGSELLTSYNDDDIYLFNTSHSTGDDFARKYKGHRNNATVKGVNFYGPRSEFIVSGSDCGNVFFWDKASSKVLQFMEGDDGGVVNVLEPHPNLPMLATSGLDKDIKIWGPSGDGTMDEEKLKKLMLSNRQERHDERNDANIIDSHLLWVLMRSLRNARGRGRRREAAENDSDSDFSSSNFSSNSDDEDEDRAARRGLDCSTS